MRTCYMVNTPHCHPSCRLKSGFSCHRHFQVDGFTCIGNWYKICLSLPTIFICVWQNILGKLISCFVPIEDMRAERNMLLRDAYPELKQFCSDLDLDFKLVDMRWGVTDIATNDHETERLCLTEVANCRRLSLGTNFVVSKNFSPIFMWWILIYWLTS